MVDPEQKPGVSSIKPSRPRIRVMVHDLVRTWCIYFLVQHPREQQWWGGLIGQRGGGPPSPSKLVPKLQGASGPAFSSVFRGLCVLGGGDRGGMEGT